MNTFLFKNRGASCGEHFHFDQMTLITCTDTLGHPMYQKENGCFLSTFETNPWLPNISQEQLMLVLYIVFIDVRI